MEPHNLLIVTPAWEPSFPHLEESCLAMIREAAPEIRITNASGLMDKENRGDAGASRELDLILADTDIIFGFMPPRNVVQRAPKLKWFHASSAGLDRLPGTDIWNSNIIITGSSGIHATVISEFALGTMLALVKKTALACENKRCHVWKRYRTGSLYGTTLGIVGLGHIGREVARLAKAFGMKVIATRRSVKGPRRARHVDLLLPGCELHQLLSLSDFVVISVPLTPATRHLIGQAELNAMKPSAFLINIARGEIIDENALTAALQEGRIAGAGLDVTAPEPLPAESPLWNSPNVIITPHVSGSMDDYMEQATRLFLENLTRFRQGRKMLNLAQRQRGY